MKGVSFFVSCFFLSPVVSVRFCLFFFARWTSVNGTLLLWWVFLVLHVLFIMYQSVNLGFWLNGNRYQRASLLVLPSIFLLFLYEEVSAKKQNEFFAHGLAKSREIEVLILRSPALELNSE